jgi:hypothetical protein
MACGTESRQESAAPHHANISTTTVSPLFASDGFEAMTAALEIPCRFVGGELGEFTARRLVDQESRAVGVGDQAPSALAYRE